MKSAVRIMAACAIHTWNEQEHTRYRTFIEQEVDTRRPMYAGEYWMSPL